ncbi:MAG TPA: YcaO-like family protein [Haliangiales bacterium]|nr:YcaO-like family protein [Haliangiales bacterium]
MTVLRVYRSSLRTRAAEETFALAAALAPGLGITRVTEITRLDRLGVPVCVAIRPDALPGNVCVSAGKGFTLAEARAGALMEAIELAFAEHGRAPFELVRATGRDVLDGRTRSAALLDLCPIWGRTLDLDEPLWACTVADLDTGEPVVVPAEAVMHPLPLSLGGARHFGSSSNGLASGNSIDEATVHALAEVIERDVTSFHNARDTGLLVRPESLPDEIQTLRRDWAERGFDLIVRYLPGEAGLPTFNAYGFDRAQPDVTLRGDGCHASRAIALARAITETVQCRLSLIHGGRDDLDLVYRGVAHLGAVDRSRFYADALAGYRRDAPQIDYADVPDFPDAATSLEACLARLRDALARAGLARVLRCVYTPPDCPIAVVRVLVPGLEFYARDTRRIGPRLRRFMRA